MPAKIAKRPIRRSSADTKARIIAAAQDAFGTKGYAQSVLTDIAKRAEVTSPLIIRYFGSKEGLFEAAFSQCIDVMPMSTADPKDFGRVAIGMMSGGHVATMRACAMLAHSIGDPRARNIAVRMVKERVFRPLVERLGGTDAAARAELSTMLGVGYTTMRLLMSLEESDAGAEGEAFITDWMGKAIQSIYGNALAAAAQPEPPMASAA
jgi:AcrR family transcriptional regulator